MRDYIASLQTLSRQQLVLLAAQQRARETQGIAVVGTACRFPGGINDPSGLWQALLAGRQLPAERAGAPRLSTGRPRWNLAAPDLAPHAELLARGVYVADVDLFEPERFGVTDDEARYLDPQQRLLVTCADQALRDAGATPSAQTRTGVFAAVSTVEYHYSLLRNRVGADGLSPYMGTGAALSATAARVAVGLGLTGPVLTTDTACSSALTAVHLASSALRRDECDLALVAVCHLQLAPFTTVVFDQAGMLSPTGRCRPFAADADGHVRGEGCAVLVLKRAPDARADGDQPYAVIRGSAVHQHGRRPTMTAMAAAGQQAVIELALRDADVDPHQVGYVEAQASGAKVGGVIEAEATAQAYRRDVAGAPPLLIGSSKANLGYLETASGAASLLKTALALSHGELPGQPDFDAPDPDIAWERLNLDVPRKRTPWPAGERRLAGVSSFGFTGTNAHVVMEAVPQAAARVGLPAGPVTGRSYWPESYTWV